MYQALYRKWRPRAFADVVGQEHITDTLRRQVAQGRLSHAYLFTGTRGTGKTTCAKILSKAVNCEAPVDGDPCNCCPACLGIDSGSLLDVLELDAASNNGVDHVRALRDEAIYSPARVKYRVYIIDEVHMLSTAAFNALLKILEEPPAHLIFILATTELHKVPATILSRCQRFAFKRILPGDITGRLLHVAGQEGMDLRPEAAELLSRLADGALRDALSLLDQCAAAGGTVDTERVLDVLGLAGGVQTARLAELLLRRETAPSLLLLHQLYAGGKDVGALLGELSALLRDVLIHVTAPQGGAALLSGGYELSVLDDLARLAEPTRLIHMTCALQSTLTALPMSANRRTDAELCLMRLCDESLCGDTAALAARIARLEAGGAARMPAAPRGDVPEENVPRKDPSRESVPWEDDPREAAPPARVSPAEKPREAESLPDAPPWPLTDADAPPAPEEYCAPPPRREAAARREESTAPPAAPAPAGGLTAEAWRELVERCKERLTPMYWFMLDDAVGCLEGDTLAVICGDDLTLETLHCDQVTEVISAVATRRLGRPVRVRYALKGASRDVAAPAEDKLEALIRTGSRFDSFQVK